MSTRVQPMGAVVVVEAERRLVVGNRQQLKTAVTLELEHGKSVVIDFGETDLIDSGGLGALVTLYRQAQEMGVRLVLANLSEELRSLLRLTKLDTIFEVGGSLDEAVRSAEGIAAEADAPAAEERRRL